MQALFSQRMDQQVSQLEHELRDGTKDRSRRLRKVSQRFLNIYKNSEMSHIDRQVKKLSTMADKHEPKAEEMDPHAHLTRSSSSSDDVLVFPVDTSTTTSCTFGSTTGAIVSQTPSPKVNAHYILPCPGTSNWCHNSSSSIGFYLLHSCVLFLLFA